GEGGVRRRPYDQWRPRYPKCRAAMDAARIKAIPAHELSRRLPDHTDTTAEFIRRRRLWFRHDTPSFQAEIYDGMRHQVPGNVLMVLLPPEHGKTTLFEDVMSLELGERPDLRFHVCSESIGLARKILGRIQWRMQADTSPFPDWLLQYGPFAPQPGRRQPWTADYANVFRRSDTDERDYSMAALGFGSQLVGSRSDRLHGDDIQSLKSLSRTESMVETIRQDWFSRTGETGYNSIFGNRVGEDDVYEVLDAELDPDLCQVVRYPPIVERYGEQVPLWPERWTLEGLDRMRRKVGDKVWETNWLQTPTAKKRRTFTAEDFDNCLWPLRKLTDRADTDGAPCYVTLDPALGSNNAMAALAPTMNADGPCLEL